MDQSLAMQIDHSLLENLPLGLVWLDRDERVGWANRAATELAQASAAELVGQRVRDLPEAVQRLLAAEPRLFHDVAGQRWVQRELQQGTDGRRLLVLADVTHQERLAEENARLRQQVEDLRLTDELTGLPNRRAISQALDLHISRSRRYQNPLSLVLVQVDMHAYAGLELLSTDPVTLAVSRFLRDRLRWVDQIARWGDDVFLLVLPETTEADAQGMLDKIGNEQASMVLPEAFGELRPRLAFGLACWAKGDDMRTLLRKALQRLPGTSGS